MGFDQTLRGKRIARFLPGGKEIWRVRALF